MPIIELHSLSKTYRSYKKQAGFLGTLRSLVHRESLEVPAVQDLTFSIEEGEVVGFLGPNGAGKTTTLKMLSGILWPTSGSATVMGFVPWERKDAFRRQFSIVMGQKNQLWWDLPAKDSFLLNKEIYEIPDQTYRKRVSELSEFLRIEDVLEIPVRKLSLGERMKCELLNSLLHNPRVLFLDEPTIGLDVVSQQSIRDFLHTWNREKKTTIVLTSHTMADVEALCRRAIVIDKGVLFYDGSLETLVGSVIDYKEVTVVLEHPHTKAVLEGFGKLVEFHPQRAVFHIPHKEVRSRVEKMLGALPLSDLLIENVPLEEAVRCIFERRRGKENH
ncbi:ABC transporter ATP-binding protein [Candidatus Uhrbacteria bacterium]|nr:ABC transporter ATP-binding protein [Candidatus Uhrbacteria bacterium]